MVPHLNTVWLFEEPFVQRFDDSLSVLHLHHQADVDLASALGQHLHSDSSAVVTTR